MNARILFLTFILIPMAGRSQDLSVRKLMMMPGMISASASISIVDTKSGSPVFEYEAARSLTPASVIKLVTSAAALELLGPDYTFKTSFGYQGTVDLKKGILRGDLVIAGRGDPALGSPNFSEHYGDFTGKWIKDLKKSGIKKIEGRIIGDDSWYDNLPVPAKWLWEDAGNYYGAGVYGISLFDNTYEIHFKTSAESTVPVVTGIYPAECRMDLVNRLIASGNTDRGYVFAAPYSKDGWIAGSIPVNREDFVLKASITDPPLLLAGILHKRLADEGIQVSGPPVTSRILKENIPGNIKIISESVSPRLREIVILLNHNSINLYAEHLTKEIGKIFGNSPSTASGISVITGFLSGAGIGQAGLAMEDGSGLSPLDAISAGSMTQLLVHMKNKGRYFSEYLESFPEAGKEGTLRYYFRDAVFNSRLHVKSGSMTGVRAFAGYVKTLSGKDLAFCIIVNHFAGTGQDVVSGIEEILKETILNN